MTSSLGNAGKILGECHEFVCERMQREGKGGAVIGYEDIGAEAFGGLGRAIVSASMYIELLGTCALLFILEVSNPFTYMTVPLPLWRGLMSLLQERSKYTLKLSSNFRALQIIAVLSGEALPARCTAWMVSSGQASHSGPQHNQRPACNACIEALPTKVAVQGDNLFQLLGPRYAPDAATYMLLAALVMIPTVWLPDLKALSGLGVVGVAATLTVTAAIAYTLISGTLLDHANFLHAMPGTCVFTGI